MTGLRGSTAFAVLTAVAVVSGCEPLAIGGPQPHAAPRGCEAVFSASRCDAMLTAAAESIGVADDDVESIEIAPDPTPRADGVIEVRGGARGIVVLVRVGGNVRHAQLCVGVASGPACMDAPSLEIESPVAVGYRDLPCPGEPPDGCATPLPEIDPAAKHDARELRIDRLVIPVPNVGRHEIPLGEAALPNGILTVAEARLEDPWPDAVRFSSEGLRLEVRSLIEGRPAFWNYYDHGWWPGTEAVAVFLVFEARRVEPGVTITVRDVVVG